MSCRPAAGSRFGKNGFFVKTPPAPRPTPSYGLGDTCEASGTAQRAARPRTTPHWRRPSLYIAQIARAHHPLDSFPPRVPRFGVGGWEAPNGRCLARRAGAQLAALTLVSSGYPPLVPIWPTCPRDLVSAECVRCNAGIASFLAHFTPRFGSFQGSGTPRRPYRRRRARCT